MLLGSPSSDKAPQMFSSSPLPPLSQATSFLEQREADDPFTQKLSWHFTQADIYLKYINLCLQATSTE